LLEQLHQLLSSGQLGPRGLVQLARELRKGFQVSILRQVQTKGSGYLLHRFDLGGAADARNRQSDVDRRPEPRVEEAGFEVDLAVGDRNDVRGYISGEVVRLGFYDR